MRRLVLMGVLLLMASCGDSEPGASISPSVSADPLSGFYELRDTDCKIRMDKFSIHWNGTDYIITVLDPGSTTYKEDETYTLLEAASRNGGEGKCAMKIIQEAKTLDDILEIDVDSGDMLMTCEITDKSDSICFNSYRRMLNDN